MLGYKFSIFEIGDVLETKSLERPILTSMGSIITENTPHSQEVISSKNPKFDKNLNGYNLFKTKIGTGANASEVSGYAYLETTRARSNSKTKPNSNISYVFTTSPKIGKLDAVRLKNDGLKPGKDYTLIKNGQSVTNSEGKVFHPADYISPALPGKFVVFSGLSADGEEIDQVSRDTYTTKSLPEILANKKENRDNSIVYTMPYKEITKSSISFLNNLSEQASKLEVIFDYFDEEFYDQEVHKFENEKIKSSKCCFSMIQRV